MLCCSVDHAQTYDFSSKRFASAFAFLRDNDLTTLPCGRNEIVGDEVFANVQEFETSPAAERSYEAHRRYIDIQYVVDGIEAYEVAPVESLKPKADFDEEGDFCTYEDPADGICQRLVLRSGELAVFGPEDAHKPGACVDAPSHVRKIVVKVLVD